MAKQKFNGWDGGLNRARQPHEIAINELQRATDVVRRFERWERRDGFTLPFTAISDGFNVTALTDFVSRAQAETLIAGNKDGLWRLSGTTWAQRLNLGSTVTDTDKWFFAEIGDASYAVCKAALEVYRSTNPASTNYTAVTWDTSTDADGEVGVDIQAAGCVLALNQRLWFFNPTTNVDGSVPEQVRWTQVNDFDRSETTDFLNLSGSHSAILSAGVLLNQLMAVYREDVINLLQNPGSPVASLRATYEPGIVSPYGWTMIPGGGHFYIARNGFFIFTGGFPQPMGRDRMTEYYLGLVNEQYYSNVHAWTDFHEEEIHISVATGSGIPNKELVYNWAKKVWSEFNRESWCGFYRYRKQTGHSVFLGQGSGNIAQVGGTTDNGVAIASSIRLKTWSPVPPNEMHESFDHTQINQIETDLIETTPGDAVIKVGTHDTGVDTPSFTSFSLRDIDGMMPDADMTPMEGRYITVEIDNFESISEAVFDFTSGVTK